MNKLVELFCDVDDFCKALIPECQKQLLEDGTKKRQRNGCMTIVGGFHMPHYRDFKSYYIGYVCQV